MKKLKCTKLTRFFSATVEHRGKKRQVAAVLDMKAGTIAIRLAGCSKRRVYNVADLFTWKPATPQLSLPLTFDKE